MAFAEGSIVRDLYRMNVVAVEATRDTPEQDSSTSPQSILMAGMVPDVTALFGPGTESELARRVGFTTV